MTFSSKELVTLPKAKGAEKHWFYNKVSIEIERGTTSALAPPIFRKMSPAGQLFRGESHPAGQLAKKSWSLCRRQKGIEIERGTASALAPPLYSENVTRGATFSRR